MRTNRDTADGDERLWVMAVGEARHRDDDLERRVCARLAAEPVGVPPATATWFALAAMLLAGVVVVVSVAWAAGRERSLASNQEPQPSPSSALVTIRAQDLPKRADYEFTRRSAIDALREIAKAANVSWVSAVVGLDKPVDCKVVGATPLQAMAAVAAAVDAHGELHGSVVAVVPGKRPDKVVTLKRDASQVVELFDAVATAAKLNIVIERKVSGVLAVDVVDAPVPDLVMAMATAVGASVHEMGRGLWRIGPKVEAAGPRVFFAFDRAATGTVLLQLSQITGSSLAEDAPTDGKVSVFTKEALLDDVMNAVAATQQCEIVVRNGTPTWCRLPGSQDR